MSALILDTETTGLDEPQVIELASSRVLVHPRDQASVETVALFRFRPTKPISLGAMAAHHIIELDLQDKPPFPGYLAPEGVEYLVGHNIDFDWKALGQPNLKRICTLALARSLWPLIDSHTLSAMMYHLLTPVIARDVVRNAHSAAGDVQMISAWLLPCIMDRLPAVATWAELHAQSENARVPILMQFGKHKGVPISQVPHDYKRWLLGQPDVDPYLRKALQA